MPLLGEDVEIVPDRDLRHTEVGAQAGDGRELPPLDVVEDPGPADTSRKLAGSGAAIAVIPVVRLRNLAFQASLL
jgi:hypothetical protein